MFTGRGGSFGLGQFIGQIKIKSLRRSAGMISAFTLIPTCT